ncbi:beta-1,3-galactosyl-O-glycosyl-glycoprotein beta-1,6-N-acetylglucosaminyltransferase 4-like [Genypterus blacodes]|uniref:beta-1,3-galactosyl-O-glycosyl-glycoprotein beta-1,6-N-acetylglucosaminyltransferase 4-like n=1 Tax=Genypterus blacodes TaxID=154954 RepID=UPI003F7623CE
MERCFRFSLSDVAFVVRKSRIASCFSCCRVNKRLLLRLRRKQFISSLWTLLAVCFLLVTFKYSSFTESKIFKSPHTLQKVHTFHKYNINCLAIYDLDPVEVGKSLIIRQTQVVEEKDESLVNLTSNCPLFMKSRDYDSMLVSEEERDFPLAYSLVVHKSAWMVERLIRALYSPINIYCIHYDTKSSPEFISAMEGLSRCLPNVFIASKRVSVIYASITRLKADLNCLSDLLRSEVKWKYAINLCGQDFPLKSNIELLSELKRLNGSNMVETSNPSKNKEERFTFHYELENVSYEYGRLPVKTQQLKDPPPHNVQMFSGNAYFVLSRAFITYINTSKVVSDFLAWSEDTYSPDEHFWATMVRMPGVPGEVPRSQPGITDLMSKTRLVKWHYLEGALYPPCTGTHIRSVCIYGAAEMNWLLNYGHWFANKFDPKVDPVIIQCLEEKLQERQKMLQSESQQSVNLQQTAF